MPCPYRVKSKNVFYCGKRIPLECKISICPFGPRIWLILVKGDMNKDRCWHVIENKYTQLGIDEAIEKCKAEGGYVIKSMTFKSKTFFRLKKNEKKKDTFERALDLTTFFDLRKIEDGKNVKIAIVDSGVSEGQDIQAISIRGSTLDLEEHGSHIVQILKELLPLADLTMIKVPGEVFADYMLLNALKKAEELRPHAINLSIQSETPSAGDDPVSIYLNYLADKGIITCVAAGNGGPRPLSVGAPGAAKNVLAIGGVNTSGHVLSWSSRGPTLDGRVKPDLSAPGQFVFGDYYLKGTSFAAPWATAMAGVLNRDLKHVKLAMRILAMSTSPFPSYILSKKAPAFLRTVKMMIDPRCIGGYGILNAVQAHEWMKEII
ncbi:MAG: S8 family serine peptidase [Nitrososphaerota archaeon]